MFLNYSGKLEELTIDFWVCSIQLSIPDLLLKDFSLFKLDLFFCVA